MAEALVGGAIVGQLKVAIRADALRRPIRQSLETAARMGARGVVVTASGDLAPENLTQTGRREFRRLLEGLDLALAAVVFPSRRGLIDPDGLEGRLEGLRRTMALSHECRSSVVCCHLGRRGTEENDPERPMLKELLADLGRYAEHVGVTLALRSGAEDPSQVQKLLGEHTSGGIGVSFDPAAVLMSGFSPVETARSLGPWIAHCQARDAVLDAAQDRHLEVPLGQGDVDWPELLGTLEEHHYEGYYSIEGTATSNPEQEIGRAVQFLRSFY